MVSTLEYIINKYHLSIGRQYAVEIPNMDRDQLATLFTELGFDLGAEIGVERGLYSETLLKANPSLYLYSIDPWVASAYAPGIHGIETAQAGYDARYEETKARLSPYRCEIMRQGSLTAARYFPDESLDFVYIDGNHDFVNVAQDLHTWSKKIRSGGIIAGHDYAFFPLRKHNHVKYVLQTYTKAYGIVPYFIVGANAVGVPGIKRDPIRSWFWIKS
ncbi:MAG: class I SAM-dependent methyltransferase [Patescibacteria group bacterium]